MNDLVQHMGSYRKQTPCTLPWTVNAIRLDMLT
jgi:hypothetical protein